LRVEDIERPPFIHCHCHRRCVWSLEAFLGRVAFDATCVTQSLTQQARSKNGTAPWIPTSEHIFHADTETSKEHTTKPVDVAHRQTNKTKIRFISSITFASPSFLCAFYRLTSHVSDVICKQYPDTRIRSQQDALDEDMRNEKKQSTNHKPLDQTFVSDLLTSSEID
jgi:hypothetical protein